MAGVATDRQTDRQDSVARRLKQRRECGHHLPVLQEETATSPCLWERSSCMQMNRNNLLNWHIPPVDQWTRTLPVDSRNPELWQVQQSALYFDNQLNPAARNMMFDLCGGSIQVLYWWLSKSLMCHFFQGHLRRGGRENPSFWPSEALRPSKVPGLDSFIPLI